MQQPEDEKAGNSKSGTQDGGGADDVYDFDGDPDDPNALDEFITDDKKIKGAGKRSQTVIVNLFNTTLRMICILVIFRYVKKFHIHHIYIYHCRLLKHTCVITAITPPLNVTSCHDI